MKRKEKTMIDKYEDLGIEMNSDFIGRDYDEVDAELDAELKKEYEDQADDEMAEYLGF